MGETAHRVLVRDGHVPLPDLGSIPSFSRRNAWLSAEARGGATGPRPQYSALDLRARGVPLDDGEEGAIAMKGVRHFLRDFTARAVREHLRSQTERSDPPPQLTRNEVELVRFIRAGTFDWAAFLAERADS